MPAAALAVHQLRYLLAYGAQARGELAEQGHAYLASLAPWIVLLLCVGFGRFVARVARALATGRAEDDRRRSFAAVWSLSACGLVGIYATQEFLEGLFATGHPSGVAGIFGDGGWWAVVAAVAVGAAVALLLRGASGVVAFAAERAAPRDAERAESLRWSPSPVVLPRPLPLAAAGASRAPPVARM
jgi:hypothetical protein